MKCRSRPTTTPNRRCYRAGELPKCAIPETGYISGMLILGVVLLLLGFFLHIQVLWIIGIILAVVGAILLVVPKERVGGRRYY